MSTDDVPAERGGPQGIEREILERMMEESRQYLLATANKSLSPDLRRKEGVSDLVQDTLYEAHRDLDQFHGRTPRQMRSWLLTILKRNMRNLVRRYKETLKRALGREVSLERELTNGSAIDVAARSFSTPSHHAIRNEQLELINRRLAQLSDKNRQLIVWHSQERLPFDEIARRAGGTGESQRKAWTRAILQLQFVIERLSESPQRPSSP